MKLPETSANVGAYYGNEENGQWQPNGVIIDSGVGGGVVGSGDAGIHRPVYPLHIPRGHVSGYVMAGGYYSGAGAGAAGFAQGPPPDDFADYMWMEHEEEFDKQVMQQLEEEALMEQCIEAMLEDEQRERNRPCGGGQPTTSNGTSLTLEETVSRSTLNPLAAEFVPTRRPAPTAPTAPTDPTTPTTPTDDSTEAEQSKAAAVAPPAEEQTEEKPKTENDAQPADDKTEAEATSNARGKKPDKKPPPRADRKKPQPARSDSNIQPKKEVVKATKSEGRVSPPPADDRAPAQVKPMQAPATPVEDVPSGPKPINYAAAAKANKPRKAAATPAPAPAPESAPPAHPAKAPPASDRLKTTKQERTATKEKPIQRKNSAK